MYTSVLHVSVTNVAFAKKNESDDEQMDELSDRYFNRQPYQMFNNALQVQPPVGRRREDPTY